MNRYNDSALLKTPSVSFAYFCKLPLPSHKNAAPLAKTPIENYLVAERII